MAPGSDTLHTSLAHVADLVEFMHDFHARLGDRELRPGEDLKERAVALEVRVPSFLAGMPLTYVVHDHKEEAPDGRAIVIVRPGDAKNAVSRRKIICASWGKYQICLECGWIWCTIVINGRF
jgi:hypothetical protein